MLEIKLILCPIDFSEFSVRAYQHALSLAEHYRAKLVAQHVVELWRYPYADYAASLGDYERFSQALREGGKEQLQEFVKNHTHDEIQPELVVQQGIAPDSILSFAQAEKTDVIVMGTHGRRGFTTYLEVLDGQRSLFNAELALAQARGNEYQSLVQLYKALGGGWQGAVQIPNGLPLHARNHGRPHVLTALNETRGIHE